MFKKICALLSKKPEPIAEAPFPVEKKKPAAKKVVRKPAVKKTVKKSK